MLQVRSRHVHHQAENEGKAEQLRRARGTRGHDGADANVVCVPLVRQACCLRLGIGQIHLWLRVEDLSLRASTSFDDMYRGDGASPRSRKHWGFEVLKFEHGHTDSAFS